MSISLGDELVRNCWRLLAEGSPHRALECAERALRTYEPPADSLLAGRLMLVVGIALHSLGSREAARIYLQDASWALENAREWKGEPMTGSSLEVGRVERALKGACDGLD